MKIFAILLLTFSLPLLAVEDCNIFPQAGSNPVPFKGKISTHTSVQTYSGCQDSLLVNDQYVVRLTQVREIDSEQKCVYTSPAMVSFACSK